MPRQGSVESGLLAQLPPGINIETVRQWEKNGVQLAMVETAAGKTPVKQAPISKYFSRTLSVVAMLNHVALQKIDSKKSANLSALEIRFLNGGLLAHDPPMDRLKPLVKKLGF